MKSAMKNLIATLMSCVAPMCITADSGGGMLDAGAPAAPAGGGQLLVDTINQFFDSADKRHLKDAMLLIASKLDQVVGPPNADYLVEQLGRRLQAAESMNADLIERLNLLATRLSALEDFTGAVPASPAPVSPLTADTGTGAVPAIPL